MQKENCFRSWRMMAIYLKSRYRIIHDFYLKKSFPLVFDLSNFHYYFKWFLLCFGACLIMLGMPCLPCNKKKAK